MNGLTILAHSFRQVVGNLGMAIRVSGWLVLIYAIIVVALLNMVPEFLQAAIDQDAEGLERAVAAMEGSGGVIFISFLAVLIFLIWSISLIAIVWHRYILLEETPRGFVPYRKGLRVFRYFWFGLLIAILAGLVLAILAFLSGLFLGPLLVSSMGSGASKLSAGAIAGTFLVGLAIGLVVLVIYFRMALILPAVALDERLTIGQAWDKTTGHGGSIFVLALALAFVNGVVPYAITFVFGGLPWVDLVLSGLFQWFYFMLNISILSTLYGHIVQKREVY